MDPACPSRGFGIRRHRIKCLTAEHYSTFPIVLLGPVERNPGNAHHRSSGPAAELNHTGTGPVPSAATTRASTPLGWRVRTTNGTPLVGGVLG